MYDGLAHENQHNKRDLSRMPKTLKMLLKEKAKIQAALERIGRRIEEMRRDDFKQKKRQEDRRRFLVGLYFYEGFEKKGQVREMKNLMNDWLTEDRDRVIWGLPLSNPWQKFNHDPERFENRKRYHIGSYFLEKYRHEGRFDLLVKKLEQHLKHPLDRRLFSP